MSSCRRERIHFSRDSSTGEEIKINGSSCSSATVCNCLCEGDCLQPGDVIYANVTWKCINGFSQNDSGLIESLGVKWGKWSAGWNSKMLRMKAKCISEHTSGRQWFLVQSSRCFSPLRTPGGAHASTQHRKVELKQLQATSLCGV